MQVMDEWKVWTLEELCKRFRVCDKTIRKWIKLGRLKRVPDCRKILITDESVRALAGMGAG
jgi:predicted site-specific integrase-resolvase